MIARMRRLLVVLATDAAPAKLSGDDKRLAMGALLVEAAFMDRVYDAAEQDLVRDILLRKFGLNDDEVDELMSDALAAQEKASDLVRFTKVIKDRCDESERVEFLELLWEVAYVDGRLDAFEDNLIRRIGGLLYVSDRQRGEARQRVLRRLGLQIEPGR
jgi:uncharacterized tellurite resistance protein B-like protein